MEVTAHISEEEMKKEGNRYKNIDSVFANDVVSQGEVLNMLGREELGAAGRKIRERTGVFHEVFFMELYQDGCEITIILPRENRTIFLLERWFV